METNENKMRIGKGSSFLLLSVAGLIDGLQALLTFLIIGVFLNPFITIFAWLLFFVWFKMLGISFMDGKKAARKTLVFAGSMMSEFVPLFNVLPAISMGVAFTILFARQEDKERETAEKAGSIARGARRLIKIRQKV